MRRLAIGVGDMFCPYCKKEAVFFKTSTHLYGSDYGPLWMCEDCVAYVGCHRGTSNPLGTLANKELRLWRKKAHQAFDLLWESGLMSRRNAYKFLQHALGLSRKQCHIAKFNVGLCYLTTIVCYDLGMIDDVVEEFKIYSNHEQKKETEK